MPNTVTDDTETSPDSHLDAAKDFFSQEPTEGASSAASAGTGQDAAGSGAAEGQEPTKPESLLSKVVKLPGAEKPADKPAEGAADTAPEDIATGLAEPKSDNAKAGWNDLKKRGNDALARAAAAEKRAAELEAKLKSSNPAADEATRARLQELETQVQTYSERLKVLDLKSHPEFVEKYVKPQSEAKAALVSIAKGDEAEINVEELLSLKGKKFNQGVSEALEQLTPYARVQFQAALERYIAADLGAQEAQAKADEFLKTAKDKVGSRSRAAFDSVSKGYSEHFIPVTVDEKAGDADKAAAQEYNAALASLQKEAEALAFGQIDEKTAAEMAHEAALYRFTLKHGLPRIGKLYDAALSERDAKIAELEGRVKALTAASPSVDGGSGGGSDDTPAAEVSHLAAAKAYFK